MKIDNDTLNELLESAIREKAAIAHMKELDRHGRVRRVRFIAYAAAACIAVLLSLGLWYGHEARKAGYAFNPVAGQMGGSAITALMQDRQILQAREAIEVARKEVAKEMEDPSSDDSDYLLQLDADSQELDLLDAVCMLRQGRYLRGKKALVKIASQGGVFATEAQDILESL